jgi:hypothetical protein
MRHFVLSRQSGHAIVTQRDPFPRVLESGPNHVAQADMLGRLRHGLPFGHFPLRREMAPEKRNAVRAICAVKSPLQTLRVIHVGCNDFRAHLRQLLRFGGVDVSGQRTRRKFARGVAQNGPGESAALRARSTENCDDLFRIHDAPPHPAEVSGSIDLNQSYAYAKPASS